MTLIFGWTLERKVELDDGVLVDIVRKGGDWVEDLMANGRFNIGEDVWWSSFAKTFDVEGQGGGSFFL